MKFHIDSCEISSILGIFNTVAETSGEEPVGFESFMAKFVKDLPEPVKGFRVEADHRGVDVTVNPDAVVEFLAIYGDLIKAVAPVIKALQDSGMEKRFEAWGEKWSAPIEQAA